MSKDDRYVLGLAAVLHTFYDQFQKRLSSEPALPPQALVKKETLEQAITLTRYFAEHRKILDQAGSRKYSNCCMKRLSGRIDFFNGTISFSWSIGIMNIFKQG